MQGLSHEQEVGVTRSLSPVGCTLRAVQTAGITRTLWTSGGRPIRQMQFDNAGRAEIGALVINTRQGSGEPRTRDIAVVDKRGEGEQDEDQ